MRINFTKHQCILLVTAIKMIKAAYNNPKLKRNVEVLRIQRKINRIENKLTKKIPPHFYRDEILKLTLKIAQNFKR